MKIYKAVPLGNTKYRLGESPFYDVRNGMFSFVDIIAGNVYTMKNMNDIKCVSLGQMVGAAVPCKTAGAYLAAATDGLYIVDGEKISLKKDMSGIFPEFQRSNDAKADPRGRLFFGSSVYVDGKEPAGNLYSLDGEKVCVLQPDTKIANGMAWSKDNKKFYFSDSPFNAVFSYDYDIETGAITNRQKLFDVNDGVPDGMCIDKEDNLWVAVWGGRRIECHSSTTGEMLARIDVQAENVTSCCFYGENMDELFITSSGENQDGKYDGYLFTCKVDFSGCEPDYYAGY